MDRIQAKTEIEELRRKIEYHRAKYYMDDAPEISDYEFENAQKYINTAIRSKLDTAGGIEDYYLDAAISGSTLSPEDLAFNTALVTKDEVIEIANSVVLDTIHYITPSGGASDEAQAL